MQFELVVKEIRKTPDFGFKSGDKWYKCDSKVYFYLLHIIPAVITIDEQIDDEVKKINLVNKLGSKSEAKLRGMSASKPHKGKDSPFFVQASDSPLFEDILSHAEDSVINALDYWEKKKQNKLTRDAIESLNVKLKEIHRLMDNENKRD